MAKRFSTLRKKMSHEAQKLASAKAVKMMKNLSLAEKQQSVG